MTDVLIAGTMGGIGDVVRESLESLGLSTVSVPFPQNIFRDESGYRRAVSAAVREHSPEMIIPVGNALALSRMKADLPSGIIVPVDNEVNLRLLDSKVLSSRLAGSLGILQPRIFGSPEEVGEDDKVIFKRDVSYGGHGVHAPRSRAALDNLISHQRKGEPYLIEEFIDGEDCSVDVLRWKGAFLYGCYRTISSKGHGPSSERVRADLPDLAANAARMLQQIDYQGVCGFDFRIGKDGRAYFLECNPRFTGGLRTQIEAGFDIPCLLWKAARGETII